MDLTSAQVAAAAAREGCRITVRQMERWRAFGLLSHGVRHGVGRGSRWTFPEETVDRIIAIARIRTKRLPLSEVGIRLWIRGYALKESDLRRWLQKSPYLRDLQHIKDRGPEAIAEKYVDSLMRAPASVRRRHSIPKRNGIRSYEMIEHFMEDLVRVIITPTKGMSDETATMLLRSVLGLSDEEKQRVAGLGLDLKAEAKDAIPALEQLNDSLWDAPMAELEMARQMAHLLSQRIDHLRTIEPNELPEVARAFIELDNKAPFASSGGVLLSLAALRYASARFSPEDVARNIAIAKRDLAVSVASLPPEEIADIRA